jgi:valyl-tRNA synthetase
LDIFYPTQLLVTGFDILFFWVARMIMLGCHFMLDVPMPDGSARTLKDAVPFREVYIHALVRDADRQKMSKTKGNVIDPIEIVGRFGTDAVRFTLAAMASPGTDIAFNEARTEGYRAFANKIWNAARFLFLQVDRAKEMGIVIDPFSLPAEPSVSANDPVEARWIVSRLNRTAKEVNQALVEYRFHEAANLVYQFFWGEVCDWYLEIVKLRLDFNDDTDKASTTAALTTLLGVFESALRMLSPFMPFLTEELWHAFYDGKPRQKSIAFTKYPQFVEAAVSASAEHDMNVLQDLIVQTRATRKDIGVEEKVQTPIRLHMAPAVAEMVQANASIVQKLARVSEISFVEAIPEGGSKRTSLHFELEVVYEKKVDVAAECDRLNKDMARFEKELANAERQLGNEGFLAKAPAHVVDGLRKREGELRLLLEKTRTGLDALGCLR